jgi:hypothetical protein
VGRECHQKNHHLPHILYTISTLSTDAKADLPTHHPQHRYKATHRRRKKGRKLKLSLLPIPTRETGSSPTACCSGAKKKQRGLEKGHHSYLSPLLQVVT